MILYGCRTIEADPFGPLGAHFKLTMRLQLGAMWGPPGPSCGAKTCRRVLSLRGTFSAALKVLGENSVALIFVNADGSIKVQP